MPSFVLSTSLLLPPPPSTFASKNNSISPFVWNYKPLSWKVLTTTNKSTKAYPSCITKSCKVAESPSEVAETIPQNEEESTLKHASRYGLIAEKMPKHVAMIIDGNQGWVKEGDWPPELGYYYACRRLLKDISRLCCELGIKVLSIYSFPSSEYERSTEVDFTTNIIESCMKSDLEEMARMGIRVSTIGNLSAIPGPLKEIITVAEETTKENETLDMIGAVNYSGRWDITQACVALMEKVEDGVIQAEDIDENLFQQQLETKCLEYGNPDLMIRTSGTNQLGNFMLWQMAYSELHFVDKRIIDCTKADFIEALYLYQQRHRRFGGHKY